MKLLCLALACVSAASSAAEVRYTIVNLETWGAPATEGSGAGAINDLGQVVGNFFTPGQAELRAFRYTDGLGFVDLGTAGWPVLHVAGLNESGQFAAYGGPLGAFRYSDGLGYQPLGSLGGWETEAYGRARPQGEAGL